MNPIEFALRRPYTVMVMVVAIALGGGLAATRAPVDVFPNLNLPVVYVCQPYGGMDPAQMEGLLTNYYEYHFLYINGIHHVESRNIQGMALMKLVFHPGTNMAQAVAETIGYVTRARAFMPPGTVSPFVTRYDAGSVPVGYLVMSSESKSIGEIQDQALFKVRPMFASLPGVSAPPPFGGNQRTIVVRIDPDRLRAYQMSPDEVTAALSAGNVISPSGTIRVGDLMPIVPINSMARGIPDLETIVIRPGQDPTVYLRDVATIKDASDIPAGCALVNGRRAVYILVTKRADASTLSVVNRVKEALPSMQAVLPDDIKVSFEFDQSPTVTSAIRGLALESALGAGLTGLMVLVFLRDWRSVIVVVLNIPFALAGAMAALYLTGQTINLMTLGGLALAVGVLVDESTVEVENIHHQMEETRSVARAVRRGNHQTAIPRLLAMICVLAVFIPSFFIQGAARELFVPLSLAVGFAMATSYGLSSTFVPVLSTWILRRARVETTRRTFLDRGRDGYARALGGLARGRYLVVPLYLAGSIAVIAFVGRSLGLEIFPKVDSGRFQLRLRAPDGTRYEKTEQLTIAALHAIEREVGGDQVAVSVGYVGQIPSSYPINAIYQWTGGPEEAILRVALKRGSGIDIESLKERLRGVLAAELPGVRLSFEPADITSEVMSFGSPTPIEIAISGPSLADDRAHAEKLRAELAAIPSLRDLQYGQSLDYPTLAIDIDRERAGLSGVTAEDVARSVVAATSSSRFVTPNYWPDPKSGIGYQVQVEIPIETMNNAESLEMVPVQKAGADQGLLLRDVARVVPGTEPGEYDRYNMKRSVSLTANIAGEDLGRVAVRVERAIAAAGPPPKGTTVEPRGQMRPLDEILRGLSIGLVASVVVIMLVLTAHFQSIRLAMVVVSTAPAVIAGVVLALWITRTTINLESFMGAIMAIGVATANAILLVSFAETRRRERGESAATAAIESARGRVRPILMTSFAMIAGMTPLALGLGESGEQSAPLARAVVGGLVAATVATLIVLPMIFALVQHGASRRSASLDPDDPESPHYHEEGSDPAASTNGAIKPGHLVGPIGLVVALVATLGCDPGARSRTNPPAAAVASVAVVTPVRANVNKSINLPGQIRAYEETLLHAKLSGYVKSWSVDIGARVKKGQVLAVLGMPELEAEAELKRASIDEAQSQRTQAEAMLEVAVANLASTRAKLAEVEAGVKRAVADLERWRSEDRRVGQLFQEHALSGSLLDETHSKLKSSESAHDEILAQVKSAEAAVVQAQAQVAKARSDVTAAAAHVTTARASAAQTEAMLTYTKIIAPYDGVVVARRVDTGDLTDAGPGGQALFTVARDDLVRVVVDSPELDAVGIEPGSRASIRVQAIPGRVFVGTVARTSWTLDVKSRTLRTEIDVANPDGKLRPGLYVHAILVVQEHENALTVPSLAVGQLEDKPFLAIVRDGRVHKTPVVLGLRSDGRTEVVSGLAESDHVIAGNPGALAQDQPVQVAPAEPVKK